ncbi:MAG: hypothetical protein PUE72_02950 [Lachnospiraceae bacterium]|nr:hypothetical protein [Lachnospiraceae bacterium]
METDGGKGFKTSRAGLLLSLRGAIRFYDNGYVQELNGVANSCFDQERHKNSLALQRAAEMNRMKKKIEVSHFVRSANEIRESAGGYR